MADTTVGIRMTDLRNSGLQNHDQTENREKQDGEENSSAAQKAVRDAERAAMYAERASLEADTAAAEEASRAERTSAAGSAGSSKKRFRDRLPSNKRYQVISFYVVVTCIIIYILARVAGNIDKIGFAIGSGLHWMRVIFIPLFWGFALAYLFAPAVSFFRRHLEKTPYYRKKNKSALGISIAITFLLVLAGIILVLTFLVSSFMHELTMVSFDNITQFLNGITKSLNEVYSQLKSWLDQMNISSDVLQDIADSITNWLGGLASSVGGNLTKSLSNLTGFFANTMFAVIFAIYFQLDAAGLKKYWKNVFHAIFGEKGYQGVKVLVGDADRVFSGYIRGQLIDALFMAVVMSIALLLLNVKFAVLIGILTGIGNLIPYVGPFVAYGCTAAVGLMSQDFQKMILSIVVVFILQTIDGNIVNPKFLSHSVRIHPMLVIISLLIGSKVGGFLGMIFAVPVAGLLKLWFDRWIAWLSKKRMKQAAQ